jgi:hypothetical protein
VRITLEMTIANVFARPAKRTAKMVGLLVQMAKPEQLPRNQLRKRHRVLTRSDVGDD